MGTASVLLHELLDAASQAIRIFIPDTENFTVKVYTPTFQIDELFPISDFYVRVKNERSMQKLDVVTEFMAEGWNKQNTKFISWEKP